MNDVAKGIIAFIISLVILAGFFFFIDTVVGLYKCDKQIEEEIKREKAATEDGLDTLEKSTPKYIDLLEGKGYISEELKGEIIKDLSEFFIEINVDGTWNPVSKGENVYLILELINKYEGGKESFRKTIVVNHPHL